MSRHIVAPVIALLGVTPCATALAQQQPDAGSLIRELQRSPTVSPPDATAPVRTTPPASSASHVTGVTVKIDAFRIVGARLVPEAELQAALASFTQRRLSFSELQKAADAIAQVYRGKGYLVRSYLPEQDLSSGTVLITVLEGQLSDVRVEVPEGGASRLKGDIAKRFVLARQRLGEAIHADDLQRGINLLNDVPGVSADLLLEPAAREGESRAVVRIKDKPLVTASALVDNAGVRSTGEWRALLSGSLDNPMGIGDQAIAMALKTEGSQYVRAGYGLPIGSDGLRATLSGSHLRYGYDTAGSRFAGTARIVELTADYPLRRGNDWNLHLQTGADDKRFRNTVAGLELNDKRAVTGHIGLNYDRADAFAGGGYTQVGLTYLSGSLDLGGSDTDVDTDSVGARRQGRFDKWTWNLTRLQRIASGHTLWLAASGQEADKNLDSSEKFGIGGTGAVRAYPSGEASGDRAWMLNAEWRYQLSDALQVTAFYDEGHVKRDHVVFAGTQTPNDAVLSGAGLGLNWQAPQGFSLRTSVAWRLGSNPLADPAGRDSDGLKRVPRVWISLVKSF